MRPVVTDKVAWSACHDRVPGKTAKTAEPIEILFGLWTLVGPGNHVLHEGLDPLWRGNYEGEGAAHCKV